MASAESEPTALDEEALQQIYTWIDGIPLSRPKKNITRDFSDGVLIAEIIYHFIPKMVDLHNYTAANSTTTKLDNWNLLSRKCLVKLNYVIEDNLVKGAVACKAGFIELILQDVRQHIEAFLARKKAANLVEKQKYHDHLSPEFNSSGEHFSYPQSDIYNHNGPNGQNYNHSGQNYEFSSGYSSDPPQSHSDGSFVPYHYQYQSQPYAQVIDTPSTKSLQHDVSAESSAKSNVENSRKPVTQATKLKSKQLSTQKIPLVSNPNENNALRIALEEKEQALLASQETVQILQAKIRRLEHLLHLKDLRISEMKNQQPNMSPNTSNNPLNQATQDHHIPPQPNFPHHPPPHGFKNFVPHPPLPQIPTRLAAEEISKLQQR